MKTKTQMLTLLKQACEKAGSQKAFAIKHDLTPPFVCDVLQGNRGLSKAVLDVLGHEEVVLYREKNEAEAD